MILEHAGFRRNASSGRHWQPTISQPVREPSPFSVSSAFYLPEERESEKWTARPLGPIRSIIGISRLPDRLNGIGWFSFSGDENGEVSGGLAAREKAIGRQPILNPIGNNRCFVVSENRLILCPATDLLCQRLNR